jgi:hypothetical protein
MRKQSATADVCTQRVIDGQSAKGPGRLVIRADDLTLTAHAGLAISGELVGGVGLVELVDGEIAAEHRAAPVKVRRRGLSPGELLLALAECQLAGGECFDDLEDLRADVASARLRAVREARRGATVAVGLAWPAAPDGVVGEAQLGLAARS